MNADYTQTQSDSDRQWAREKSAPRDQPPASVPGVDLVDFLGDGAFGEVWIGVDNNTGRRVAVKFFARRQDVAWAGLSSEVEKLVLLSNDRRIVQLLKVGWQTDPPYYVMEYVDSGSLEDDLQRSGPWPAAAAAELFVELAKALQHAHGKGVLHCDLKPANVLLDHDHRPRVCDFGQSRLARETKPALGTFFFMAPEQASLEATPDVRWDVWGLGAILYACLTGHPPYWSSEADRRLRAAKGLEERLACYREILADARPLQLDRQAGVDRRLASIVERCLERDPRRRFANIQEVLDALEQRAAEQRRRPLVLLGGVAPLVLVLITALFAYRGMRGAVESADRALTQRVRKSNEFAAQFVAARVTADLEKYFAAVEQRAADGRLIDAVQEAIAVWEEVQQVQSGNKDPAVRFRDHLRRKALQQLMETSMEDAALPQVASWFVCGPDGTQLAAAFDRPTAPTIGHNFAWRTYFHGGTQDLPRGTRPSRHLEQTQISALMKSTATNTWKVAVSTPLRDPGSQRFLGVVAVTFEIGRFITFFDQRNAAESRFAVLVDGRKGPYYGVILQHPLYQRWRSQQGSLPEDLTDLRIDLESVRGASGAMYQDPLADEPLGAAFRRSWIAALADVRLPRHRHEAARDSGLVVLIQEDHDTAVAPVVQLEADMRREGLIAAGLISITVLMAWYLVLRRLTDSAGRVHLGAGQRRDSSMS